MSFSEQQTHTSHSKTFFYLDLNKKKRKFLTLIVRFTVVTSFLIVQAMFWFGMSAIFFFVALFLSLAGKAANQERVFTSNQ